ncbi:hypothetical protein H0H81_002570 [Sphagnurus paluster]|uniref:Uncharacterized protein n=1 Tax=Sphagnurus paluster TaxID=117069 RepID=A0A9P7GMI5_9AGAR|nr:hypothetical protein H0H81_002570 [Sphagnurus paluster]
MPQPGEEDTGQCYEYIKWIENLMQRHALTIRGCLLEPVHAQVVAGYSFREGGKERDVNRNKIKAQLLYMSKKFHYKIDHCIKEWFSGHFIRKDFSEAAVIKSYKIFYADLKK